MEGKFELQFEDNEYYLVDGNTNDTVATTDKVLLKEYDGYMKKLSLKNCEDVANGYDLDLDKLACDWHKNEYGFMPQLQVIKAYISGFQKALELLGDKKFNYGHLDKMFTCGKLYQDSKNEAYCFDNVLNKFQQTEWDVIIEMECPECKEWGYISECRNNCNQKFLQPKLDADGCLILKRK